MNTSFPGYFTYDRMRSTYERIKPIRGRDPDTRPIGQRRRTWETIREVVQDDGTKSYAVRLYNTDVVEYFHNGDIVLRTGGWDTPSTAAFMNEHSPFSIAKVANRVWARSNGKSYPVGKELRFVRKGDVYEPAQEVIIRQQVLDKSKTKTAREEVKPFVDWCVSFLRLSDGWLMHETCKEILGVTSTEYGPPMYANFETRETYVLKWMQSKSEEDWGKALCSLILFHTSSFEERNVAEVVEYKYENRNITYNKHFYNYKVGIDSFRRLVQRIVYKHGDVHTVRELPAADRPIYQTV